MTEKEKNIFNSQIKQHQIENALKRLENKRQNILYNKKSILSKILSFIIYDFFMLLIISTFIYNVINNFTSIPVLFIVYTGVISLSLTGAYLSSAIEIKIRKRYNRKRLNIISNKIKDKKYKLNLEKEKIEKLKKEIRDSTNNLDNQTVNIYKTNDNNTNNIIYRNNNNNFVKTKNKVKRKTSKT